MIGLASCLTWAPDAKTLRELDIVRWTLLGRVSSFSLSTLTRFTSTQTWPSPRRDIGFVSVCTRDSEVEFDAVLQDQRVAASALDPNSTPLTGPCISHPLHPGRDTELQHELPNPLRSVGARVGVAQLRAGQHGCRAGFAMLYRENWAPSWTGSVLRLSLHKRLTTTYAGNPKCAPNQGYTPILHRQCRSVYDTP